MVDKLLTKPRQAEGVVASTVVDLCKRGNGLLVSCQIQRTQPLFPWYNRLSTWLISPCVSISVRVQITYSTMSSVETLTNGIQNFDQHKLCMIT